MTTRYPHTLPCPCRSFLTNLVIFILVACLAAVISVSLYLYMGPVNAPTYWSPHTAATSLADRLFHHLQYQRYIYYTLTPLPVDDHQKIDTTQTYLIQGFLPLITPGRPFTLQSLCFQRIQMRVQYMRDRHNTYWHRDHQAFDNRFQTVVTPDGQPQVVCGPQRPFNIAKPQTPLTATWDRYWAYWQWMRNLHIR